MRSSESWTDSNWEANRDRPWAGGWLSAFCQILVQSLEASKDFKLKPRFSGCYEGIFAKWGGYNILYLFNSLSAWFQIFKYFDIYSVDLHLDSYTWACSFRSALCFAGTKMNQVSDFFSFSPHTKAILSGLIQTGLTTTNCTQAYHDGDLKQLLAFSPESSLETVKENEHDLRN